MARTKHQALAVDTVATLTLTGSNRNIRVINHSLTTGDSVYFTVDGSTPTVKGDNTWAVGPGTDCTIRTSDHDGSVDVKLISHTTPDVSAEMVDEMDDD